MCPHYIPLAMHVNRVTVEHARGPRRHDSGRDHGRGMRASWVNRYGAPLRSKYRLIVQNLSTKVSWQVSCDCLILVNEKDRLSFFLQDLKDLMRRSGDVTFANAHRDRRHEGYKGSLLSCFKTNYVLTFAESLSFLQGETWKEHSKNTMAMSWKEESSKFLKINRPEASLVADPEVPLDHPVVQEVNLALVVLQRTVLVDLVRGACPNPKTAQGQNQEALSGEWIAQLLYIGRTRA